MLAIVSVHGHFVPLPTAEDRWKGGLDWRATGARYGHRMPGDEKTATTQLDAFLEAATA